MQACEDVLKNLVFLTLSVREEEREVGKEEKQERVKWKRREGERGEVGKKGKKREGRKPYLFYLPGTNVFHSLKKTQVFINFAKDQKSYENVDTSSHGSSISVDSQDGQRES